MLMHVRTAELNRKYTIDLRAPFRVPEPDIAVAFSAKPLLQRTA